MGANRRVRLKDVAAIIVLTNTATFLYSTRRSAPRSA
eukprot:SAG22_NODE_4644_length_1207_cov_0.974729_1_plen_36_part_10